MIRILKFQVDIAHQSRLDFTALPVADCKRIVYSLFLLKPQIKIKKMEQTALKSDELLKQNQGVQQVFLEIAEALKQELSKLETPTLYKTWITNTQQTNSTNKIIDEFFAYLFHLALDENDSGEYILELTFDDSILNKASEAFQNALLRHFFVHTAKLDQRLFRFDSNAYDVHSYFLAVLEDGEDAITRIGVAS